MSGSQLGDLNQGDIAGGNIYNISASIDALVEMLHSNLERVNLRVSRLEEIELQHAQERQALTRALMMLANESTSVKVVQRQLEEQIASEQKERASRRRYLDRVLYGLIAVHAISIGLRLGRRHPQPDAAARLV